LNIMEIFLLFLVAKPPLELFKPYD
jgi:hypothetical protein